MTLLGRIFGRGRTSEKMVSAMFANVASMSLAADEFLRSQEKTNQLLAELIKTCDRQAESYGDFINVIQNFFAIEKRLRMEEARAKAAKEQEFDMTKDDLRY